MLTQSCETLIGVGPMMAAKLAKLNIFTIQDLLFHLPYRYQDRTRITPISDLRPGDWAVIGGEVYKTEIKYAKRMMLYCHVKDKTGFLKLRFFNFHKNQIKLMETSKKIRAFGEIRVFANQWEMIHPEYQLLFDDSEFIVEETLTPIYPMTQGLTQTRLRQLIKQVLTKYSSEIKQLEWMPKSLQEQYALTNFGDAIIELHNPPPHLSIKNLEEGNYAALKRLVLDELLAQQLSMRFARQNQERLKAPKFGYETLAQEFINNLPFKLTNAQKRVFAEIKADLKKDDNSENLQQQTNSQVFQVATRRAEIERAECTDQYMSTRDEAQQSCSLKDDGRKPMMRLLQGDVGSGKTIIAALTSLLAIDNGYQVALMVPTDILSEQHYKNFSSWFTPLGIKIARLSGKIKPSEAREILKSLADNQCQIVIGTHALFQESVKFAELGLVIIDEHHRFGVQQRLRLQQKNAIYSPHQLFMTATPIPRTLAMTQYAHLDLSIIDELPPNRSPIITAILSQEKRQPVIERLQNAIAQGRQAYWVCTLIEESEKLQCMAATVTAKNLQQQLESAKVGLIHGRMDAAEKESIMQAFKNGHIDLLVATTVIEVGVDVPNASLMIIENAERLGLSQLHQLRGRIGRGNIQSHCLLLYQPPLSFTANLRLQIMRDSNDGFVIAEKDLAIRGQGEFLGIKQTGYRNYKIADLLRDQELLPLANKMAQTLLQTNPVLAKNITHRWLGNFEHFLQS